MKFKNFRLLTLIEILIVSFIYPFVKMFISSSNKTLILSDTIIIEALVLLLFGLIFHLYQKGNFRYSFIIFNKISHNNISNDKFLKDDQVKRESSFNYSLFASLILFAIGLFIAYFFV